MAAASTVPTDAEDRDMLRSLGMAEYMVDELIRVKHNDPECWLLDRLWLSWRGDERAVKRMGQILGQAKHLEDLTLRVADHPHLAEFCAELQSNRSIECLQLTLENRDVDVSSFAPFLRDSAAVTDLSLVGCRIQSATELLRGSAAVTDLSLVGCSLQSATEPSNAILESGGDALTSLHISQSLWRDVGLDWLLALRNLRHLSCDECGIGARACVLLASLLSDRQSKLFSLSLENNSIDDEAVSTLVDSLAGNTTLMTLYLEGNDRISKDGWLMLLRLVCNCEDVAKSNHCLYDLGIFDEEDESPSTAAAIAALGENNANLLRASLEVNHRDWLMDEKHAAIKRKMIWCHARGDLNIGEERSIDVGVLPRILAWFAGRSNGTNASLIQYHGPPLSDEELSAIRLGSLYRIVRERPEMLV